MKKYDTYKDSGNQWIGQVPEHWCLYSLKYYLNLQKGRKPEEFLEEGDLPYVTMDYIRSRENKTCLYPSSTEGLVPINDDDMLVLWDGANAGEIVKAKKGFLSSTMAVLDFDKKIGLSQYLFYLLKKMEPTFKTFANGTTIPHFDSSILLDYKYPLPPLSEQQAIVEFLDKKTGKIDQSIALLETQKTDLLAYRQALITETVTKGLNSNAPMKDSGIQWIGEIPEGWEMKRLKHFTALLTDGTHQTPTYLEEGVPFLSIKDISTGKIDFSDVKYISEEEHLALQAHAPVEKGDIIFTRIGTLGVFLKVDTDIVFDIFVSVGLIKLIPNSVNADYLVYYLSSNMIQEYISFTKVGEGTSAPKINLTNAKNMPIITPPLSEQQAIVEYLDKKTSDIDTAIQKINTQIADLQAYRTALISEAVTGKIDVRNQ